MKGEIKEEVIKKNREMKEPTKDAESIESPRFNWNKTVEIDCSKEQMERSEDKNEWRTE